MSYEDIFANPLLATMAPEKIDFLTAFAKSAKPTDTKSMMPFLLATIGRAKKNKIRFSDEETDLLFAILKQNMSDDEAAKADKMINLMKSRSSGGNM
jgi:hypothetical protein